MSIAPFPRLRPRPTDPHPIIAIERWIDAAPLTPMECVVLRGLARFVTRPNGGVVRVSWAQVAAKSKASRATVKRVLKRAEEQGWLHVEHGGTERKRNRYRFTGVPESGRLGSS